MGLKFSIKEMSSVLQQGGGLAKASHYYVHILPPPAMRYKIGEITSIDDITLDTVTKFAGNYFKANKLAGLATKCESTELPGKRLATTEFVMYGTYQQLPYGINYDPWTANFICTNSMLERNFFDSWMKAITDPFSNNFQYYKEYVTDIFLLKLPEGLPELQLLNLLDLVARAMNGEDSLAEGIAESFGVYIMKLEEAYPIQISSQPLSYESEDYINITVEFAYRKFHSLAEFAVF